MSNTKWIGTLTYRAKHTDIDSVLSSSFVPVTQFAVKGGAKRQVDLNLADDISVVSEFEQARMYKNISLYLPRTKGFEWHHLWEIAHHRLPLTIAFFTSGSIGKTVKHQFTLISENAKITDSPVKQLDWSNREMLKVSLSLPETKLIHGSYQGSDLVEENW